MSKEMTPLEALGRIKKLLEDKYGLLIYVDDLDLIETAIKDYENLKLKHRSMQDAVLDDFKKLKALDIIKEKQKLILEHITGISVVIQGLAKEEFVLLKEVFDEWY